MDDNRKPASATTKQVTLSGTGATEEATQLRARVGELAAERDLLEKRLAETEAKLGVIGAELDALKKRVGEQSSLLPDLPAQAFELAQSVTIPLAIGSIVARKGDVLTVGEVKPVEAIVAGRARVFQVPPDVIEEIRGLGMLR